MMYDTKQKGKVYIHKHVFLVSERHPNLVLYGSVLGRLGDNDNVMSGCVFHERIAVGVWVKEDDLGK